MDVLTVLDVLIEPNAKALVDENSLVAALENIELVPSEFVVSRYYETLEHQLSTIYRQFMLVYEDSLGIKPATPGHLFVPRGHLFMPRGHLFATKGHLFVPWGQPFVLLICYT